MSIGRNYRLDLEKRLREINKSRENTLNLKILDDHSHLIKPSISTKRKKSKSKNKPDVQIDNSPGVVPLMVNHIYYCHFINFPNKFIYIYNLNFRIC